MPVTSRPGRDELPTATLVSGTALWPWSYRVAGAMSSWPALELYEAGSLIDVVTSTRLTAQVLRGARVVRSAAGGRVLAWGRLPLSGGAPVVEFGGGALRDSCLVVPPAEVTSWCWLAIADARYNRVTVRYDGMLARRRPRVSRPPC